MPFPFCVFPGVVEGAALVSPGSFPLSGVTFEFGSGNVKWPGHELNGQSVRHRVLVLPEVRGFAGGDWALYSLSVLCKTAPLAILCADIGSFIAAGAILGKIVTVAQLPAEFLRSIESGAWIRIDSTSGVVGVTRVGARQVNEVEFAPMKGGGDAEFQLSTEDRAMLASARGAGAAECLSFLVDYGKALGANRLIEVEGVHVAGSGYNTTGDAAIAYLTHLSQGGRKSPCRLH